MRLIAVKLRLPYALTNSLLQSLVLVDVTELATEQVTNSYFYLYQ